MIESRNLAAIDEAFARYFAITNDALAASNLVLAATQVDAKQATPEPVEADAPMTVQQAARRSNLSPRTVYALCNAKKLPHSRLGTGRGTIRIMLADLVAYLRQTQTGEVDYLS